MAQLAKNLPAMWETWIWSLGWEDPLEKGKATHSSILAWRIPWSHKELDMTEQLPLFTQAPQSLGFSRQESWSELPFPSPEDLPDLGIEPRCPALQADFFIDWALKEALNKVSKGLLSSWLLIKEAQFQCCCCALGAYWVCQKNFILIIMCYPEPEL